MHAIPYCAWRMIIRWVAKYPQTSRGCHEKRTVIASCWQSARACVCTRKRDGAGGKEGERARSRNRKRGGEVGSWHVVSDGAVIRSDSSITDSCTCDKSGTRSPGRLKAMKMEFERHPGGSLSCIYDSISTFVPCLPSAPFPPSRPPRFTEFRRRIIRLWN